MQATYSFRAPTMTSQMNDGKHGGKQIDVTFSSGNGKLGKRT